ncbi:hypothetical protein, partial [Stenotrophomonas indicatrix]|uniref:hypothetical protein n=1 Tax=Stenotrophomonas indicatrix TaxID=2045451 RepID=UPI001F0819A6
MTIGRGWQAPPLFTTLGRLPTRIPLNEACEPKGRPRRCEDDRLRGLIKHAWLASGTVYGYRKITRELWTGQTSVDIHE